MIMFSDSEDEEVVHPGKLFIRRLKDSQMSKP